MDKINQHEAYTSVWKRGRFKKKILEHCEMTAVRAELTIENIE